ncbi:hypothetical protein, partial [Mitsuokella multacida]|uniref:hypothetical protein n=1 Tax=Mitsuokella multacida TaxID=52226 RepID=UPI00242F6B21
GDFFNAGKKEKRKRRENKDNSLLQREHQAGDIEQNGRRKRRKRTKRTYPCAGRWHGHPARAS